ncbi:L,D-transpeptidase family protein [Flexithrix dorotheae]|uniref:L,D-transpeptidase family protein n=1 Tax=Flexithrix dorotheae TaxID=70993 RepID=UPI0003731CA0|nr:L,D-transpeptidase family protein [Flexithrix dorotheae]
MKNPLFKLKFLSFSIFLGVLIPISVFSQIENESSFEIKRIIVALHEKQSIEIEGVAIFSKTILPVYYETRNFEKGWVSKASVDSTLKTIELAYLDGLHPEDYHLGILKRLKAEIDSAASPNPITNAHFDILLTDAVLLYARHLFDGKVHPQKLQSTWNLQKRVFNGDTLKILQDGIANNQISKILDSLKPQGAMYKGLKEYLAHYLEIAQKGGWGEIEEGPTLRHGMANERVKQVRKRLAAEGFLPDMGMSIPFADLIAIDTLQSHNKRVEEFFDQEMAEAVARFQKQYSLDVDSAIGKMTIKAMNIPVEDRINQIRVNLERSRWVMGNLGKDFLVVNIAGFELFLIKNGEEVWHTNVVVGKKYHETPVFKDQIKYIVFNPTWTIPRSIVEKETLPKMRIDPNYINSHHMEIVDNSGRIIPQSALDPSSLTISKFPYQIRQKPGDHNALGRVKFIFPNSYSIYLHDTPSKSFFSRTSRAFSHGCVRVENPLILAEKLLDDPENFNQAKIQEILKTNKTKNVFLKEKLDVILLYWTAEIHPDGKLYFKEDVYGRDKAVLRELDEDRPKI